MFEILNKMFQQMYPIVCGLSLEEQLVKYFMH